MKKVDEIGFSVPYDIAVARPIRRTTRAEREAELQRACHNTDLISPDMAYIDLHSDAGGGAPSVAQAAASVAGGASHAEKDSVVDAVGRFKEIFGFPYVVPCLLGRAAERVWLKINVRQGTVVPGNMLFPSTRFHIDSNGAKVVDVISDKADDLFSDDPFKGNVDLDKLEKVIGESGAGNVSCIYVEVCVNSAGGHPVSLANLHGIRAIAEKHKIPVFLDACRILENSYLIQQREQGYRDRTIPEIVRETCALADGLTMSALKDFLVPIGGFIATRDEKSYGRASFQQLVDGEPPPSTLAGLALALAEVFSTPEYIASRVRQVEHLWRRLADRGVPVLRPAGGHGVFIDARKFLPHMAPEQHPAEALAAYVYALSGVRASKGPPLTRRQIERGVDLLRLAVPARRYLKEHMDDVADAFLYAYERREEIPGLKSIEKPGRSKYAPGLFTPLS
jgi:tyrosine phenol-lyase